MEPTSDENTRIIEFCKKMMKEEKQPLGTSYDRGYNDGLAIAFSSVIAYLKATSGTHKI